MSPFSPFTCHLPSACNTFLFCHASSCFHRRCCCRWSCSDLCLAGFKMRTCSTFKSTWEKKNIYHIYAEICGDKSSFFNRWARCFVCYQSDSVSLKFVFCKPSPKMSRSIVRITATFAWEDTSICTVIQLDSNILIRCQFRFCFLCVVLELWIVSKLLKLQDKTKWDSHTECVCFSTLFGNHVDKISREFGRVDTWQCRITDPLV